MVHIKKILKKKKKKTVGKVIREGIEMHFNRQGFSQ